MDRLFRIGLYCLLMSGCVTGTLPTDFERSESYALPPAKQGLAWRIAEHVARQAEPGESGTLLLENNAEAMRWRLALIDSATTSLDIQYYLWYPDATGAVLMLRALKAADRGVRVRVLVDDFLIRGDGTLGAAIAAHPNVSARVFNPWTRRTSSSLAIALEWLQRQELNHRMHNKLLVADNRLAIVGGRNVGNEYFGLNERRNFADMDMLLIGPVARDLSATFDDFWNDEWAFPAEVLVSLDEPETTLADYRQQLRTLTREQVPDPDLFLPDGSNWQAELDERLADIRFSRTQALTDSPSEVRAGAVGQVITTLKDLADQAEEELVLISAYFVPPPESIPYLGELVDQGVRVRVLTNSLASNNHTVAHSQYRKQRRRLLKAGVELYEMRHNPLHREDIDTDPIRSRYVVLHTKAIIMDRDKLYIGALNLSPRSALINTENGVLVDDPDASRRLAEYIEEQLHPDNSWRLHLDDQGRIVWVSCEGTRTSQPALSGWQRFADWFYGLFPLAGQI